MAGRILNRRELREQSDQAEQLEAAAAVTAKSTVSPKKKAKAATGAKKPRKRKTQVRVRARWGVFDSGMKQVAIFDYNQREAADAKLAALLASKKGTHFLQIVKEPIAETAPDDGSAPA